MKKVELEMNGKVAGLLLEWGKQSFGSSTLEEVVQEIILNYLTEVDADPDNYSAAVPPKDFWALFSKEGGAC